MSWLRRGAPWIAVAVVAILAIAALRADDSPIGFASMSLSEGSCQISPERSKDVVACARVRDDVYRVIFVRPIGDRAAVATRETCCPGQVTASVESDRSVLIALPEQRRYPVVVTVAVL